MEHSGALAMAEMHNVSYEGQVQAYLHEYWQRSVQAVYTGRNSLVLRTSRESPICGAVSHGPGYVDGLLPCMAASLPCMKSS